MIRLVELVFGIVLKSEDSHQYIENIMALAPEAQFDLQLIIRKSLALIDGEDE